MGEQRQKFLFPVTLDATSGSIDVSETGGGSDTITLTGKYWAHNDSSMSASFASLFEDLISELNSSSSLQGNYSIAAGAPLGPSSEIGNFGLTISMTGSPSAFSFTPSAPSTTPSPTLADCLGMPKSGAVNSIGTTMHFPMLYAGSWVAPHMRTLAAPDVEPLLFPSTEFVELEDAYSMDYGDRNLRLWRFEEIAAAHIFRARASIEGYADTAGLTFGDGNNAFEELYKQAVRNEDIIVVNYSETTPGDLQIDAHDYEVVRFLPTKRLSDIIGTRPKRLAGEFYDLQFRTVRRSGDLNY